MTIPKVGTPKVGTVKRSVASQSLHDRMVSMVAKDIDGRANFTKVRADHINWPGGSPDMVNGHRPDISALEARSGKRYKAIWEVETRDSLDSQETVDQCKAFSRWKKAGHGYFYLAVPESIEIYAKAWATKNGIEATAIWTITGH